MTHHMENESVATEGNGVRIQELAETAPAALIVPAPAVVECPGIEQPPAAPKLPAWKRAMDVAGASAALLLLSPIFLATTCLIRLLSPGPAIFKQQRVGLRGRPFTIWKFRTMRIDADSRIHRQHVAELARSDSQLVKLDTRSDLIPLGGVLRTLCIDELPQLVNVLRGEMSLVGPRPDVIARQDYEPPQRRRLEAVPGMTGLWQVRGKNRTTFREMIELDVQYVDRRSLWLDCVILLVTVPAILRECISGRGS